MIYFRSTTVSLDSALVLYGIELDTGDIWPWLICAALGAAGGYGCKITYPRVAEAYSAAMHEARALVTT